MQMHASTYAATVGVPGITDAIISGVLDIVAWVAFMGRTTLGTPWPKEPN